MTHRRAALWLGLGVALLSVAVVRSDMIWTKSVKYDSGRKPTVAVRGNTVVEAHQSETTATLWYHVGCLDASGKNLTWGTSVKYDTGAFPAIGVGTRAAVVEVHKSEATNTLWYHVGKFAESPARRD